MKTFEIALIITASIASAAFISPAYAQNDKVLRGPIPEWAPEPELLPLPENPRGLTFIRQQTTQIHLDADGQSQYQSYRVHLLHPQALAMGNVTVSWNPSVGAPIVHKLLVHRGSRTIDILESNEFQILRRENQLEAAFLDGMLTAVLQVPDLRVGDELEMAVTLRSHDMTLGSTSFGTLILFNQPPPGRFVLGLNWDKGQKPNIAVTPDLEPFIKRQEHSISASFDNPEILTPPKDAPPRFLWQRAIQYSDFKSWPAASQRFYGMFAKAAELSSESEVKQEAAQIAADHASELDRASAALKLVQAQVRYIYVGLNGGNYTPISADETWRLRYGDCKGKTVLLLALLSELGIEAEPVLVRSSGSDDGINERLPSPDLFDHVIIRAKIDGKDYWLDGTLPSVARPDTKPLLPYNWVLPITKNGSDLLNLPWKPDALPAEMVMYDIDASAGFDQPASVTETYTTRGIAAVQKYMQLSPLSDSQLFSTFQTELTGNGAWVSIEKVEYDFDVKAQADILKISGTQKIDWDDDGGGAYSLALPGGGFNPPTPRLRPENQNQNIPYYNAPDYNCYVTTVRLPAQTDSKNWSYNTEFGNLIYGKFHYRTFTKSEKAIRMVRGAIVKQREISAAHAKRDNGVLEDFDNSKAWIIYNPHRLGKIAKSEGEGEGEGEGSNKNSKSATDEIDWKSPQTLCLPSYMID